MCVLHECYWSLLQLQGLSSMTCNGYKFYKHNGMTHILTLLKLTVESWKHTYSLHVVMSETRNKFYYQIIPKWENFG